MKLEKLIKKLFSEILIQSSNFNLRFKDQFYVYKFLTNNGDIKILV